jgi:hypothetical protein
VVIDILLKAYYRVYERNRIAARLIAIKTNWRQRILVRVKADELLLAKQKLLIFFTKTLHYECTAQLYPHNWDL